MKKSLRIRWKKKTQSHILIGIMLMLPFLFFTLIDLLRFPSSVKYICDIAWICLLILLLVQKRKCIASLRRCIAAFLIWLLATFLIYLTKFQSPLYYLWGVRNNFRFYVAFVACAYFLCEEDIASYLKLFDRLFWINGVLCFIQYVLLKKRQDYLGGIFGVEKGCNGYLNIFFVIIITKSLIFYLHKRETTLQCVAKCFAALLIAAWAELKFFYVELVVIIATAVLLTDFSWKKVGIIFGGIVGILLSTVLLGKIFPEFENFFTVSAIMQYASNTSGYTGRGDLNRFTAIPSISELFLTTPISKLLGLGLGNCDVASFRFLTTPFYTRYQHMHYTWFSTSFIFVETGYLGLAFFFGFFCVAFLKAKKQLKKENGKDSVLYCQIAAIVAVCAIMVGIYNSSLRSEAGYMIYFVLSFPYIIEKKENSDNKESLEGVNVDEKRENIQKEYSFNCDFCADSCHAGGDLADSVAQE